MEIISRHMVRHARACIHTELQRSGYVVTPQGYTLRPTPQQIQDAIEYRYRGWQRLDGRLLPYQEEQANVL